MASSQRNMGMRLEYEIFEWFTLKYGSPPSQIDIFSLGKHNAYWSIK